MKLFESLGRTALKAIAAIGSGGVTAIGVAILVGFWHLDVASPAGAAMVGVITTFATALSAYAVRKAATPTVEPMPGSDQ